MIERSLFGSKYTDLPNGTLKTEFFWIITSASAQFQHMCKTARRKIFTQIISIAIKYTTKTWDSLRVFCVYSLKSPLFKTRPRVFNSCNMLNMSPETQSDKSLLCVISERFNLHLYLRVHNYVSHLLFRKWNTIVIFQSFRVLLEDLSSISAKILFWEIDLKVKKN